jgi:RNA recognition motif-containing protein
MFANLPRPVGSPPGANELTAANLATALSSLKGPAIEERDEDTCSNGVFSSESATEPQQPQRAGTNVYVSNLPSSMNSSKFRLLFGAFGTIIGARLVKRRKGDAPVGFVQFTTQEMAANAIKTMDGRNVEGSSLSVRLANRDKDKGINNKPSSNLYVANLPQKVTELDLRMIFSRYGDIHSLRVLKYPNTGVSKGTALVRFVSIEDATRAKKSLHCLPLHGQDLPLEVKYAETKEEKLSRRDNRSNNAEKQKAKQQQQQQQEQTSVPTSPLAIPQRDPLAGLADVIERYRQHWKHTAAVDSPQPLTPTEAEDMLAACMDEPTSRPISPPVQPEPVEADSMRALTDYIKRMMDGKAEEEDALKPEDMDTRSSNSFCQDSSIGHRYDDDSSNSPSDVRSPEHHTPIGSVNSTADFFLEPEQFVPELSINELVSDLKPHMDSLKIEGLRGDTDRLTLYEMFAPWGAILELDSMVQGNGNATAVVKFRNPSEAAEAKKTLHGSVFQGRTLSVDLF